MEKWMVVLVAAGFLIPYGTVLAVTGNIHGAEYVRQQEKEAAGKYRILLDREENGGYLSLEEYLPSVLAAQISPDSEMEALKAQAVIARTYIRRQMGEEKEISELSLDLDRKPREELKKIWGKTEFPEKYSRLEEAVIQTNRIVMTYDGEMIAPLFCAVTAGSTRDGDEGYPYLKSVSCPDDEKAADFISFVSLSAKQAAAALNEIPGKEGEVRQVRPEAFPGKVQTVKRDTAGYVQEIQIDE